jgi:hypothetical protein
VSCVLWAASVAPLLRVPMPHAGGFRSLVMVVLVAGVGLGLVQPPLSAHELTHAFSSHVSIPGWADSRCAGRALCCVLKSLNPCRAVPARRRR